MADDNKPLKYARYAIGEIVLVVIGILIALQINSWNEERKNKAIEFTYYNLLLQDFNEDQVFIQKVSDHFNSNVVKYNDYLKKIDRQGVPIDSNAAFLGDLHWYTTPVRFQSNTINTLQNTGEIKLISPEIRNKLVALKALEEVVKERYEYLKKDYTSRVSHATSLTGGGATYSPNLKNPDFQDYFSDKKRIIESIMAFQSVQEIKNLAELEMLERLEEVREDIDELTRLINSEIKK